MIGIGISTFGREETAKHAIEHIIKFAPEGSKIVIIQDVQGIAKAKNQCLAQLDECSDIFLFDDDCYPTKQYWWLTYINSGEPHLCFTFSHLRDGRKNGNRELIKKHSNLNVFQNPSGCMIYLNKKCIDTVGGFDEEYDIYGHEHCDLSVRIHNAGLTSYPFMDVENSLDLFYSHDYNMTVTGSLPPERRMLSIRTNRPKYFAMVEAKSKEWKPYK